VAFIQRDVLYGIPIKDGSVDLVHASMLMFGLPCDNWPAITSEVARILKPGGYFELRVSVMTMRRETWSLLYSLLQSVLGMQFEERLHVGTNFKNFHRYK
jgi:hypothetical protein